MSQEREKTMAIIYNNEENEEEWQTNISNHLQTIETTQDYFNNFEQSPFRAVLLWYLNAGYARFCGLERSNNKKY